MKKQNYTSFGVPIITDRIVSAVLNSLSDRSTIEIKMKEITNDLRKENPALYRVAEELGSLNEISLSYRIMKLQATSNNLEALEKLTKYGRII